MIHCPWLSLNLFINSVVVLLKWVLNLEKQIIIIHPSKVSKIALNENLSDKLAKKDMCYFNAHFKQLPEKEICFWFFLCVLTIQKSSLDFCLSTKSLFRCISYFIFFSVICIYPSHSVVLQVLNWQLKCHTRLPLFFSVNHSSVGRG